MVALIVYHRNAQNIYPQSWLDKFKDSILNQTFQDFEIYECEYGDGDYRIFESSHYESKELPTFVHAMNYLIEKALNDGAEVMANSNVDDWVNLDWLKIQVPLVLNGYDLVSCNFSLVQDDQIVKEHKFHNLNIKEELEQSHNPICHPAICVSRKYFQENKYDPTLVPFEDLILWQQTIDKYRFKIVPENLLYHRIHNQSVCQSTNR